VPPGIYAGCLGPAIVTALAANPGAREARILLDVDQLCRSGPEIALVLFGPLSPASEGPWPQDRPASTFPSAETEARRTAW
jgi:hypothetical protein